MLDVLIDWRLEIYAGLAFAFLLFLRHRYAGNQIVAEYVRGAVEAIATRVENSEDEPAVTPDSPHATRSALRKKVRRQLAKQARKANRGTR